MTTPRPPEERLLGSILQRAERPSSALPIQHLDDETLALFVEGVLPARDRPAVVAHLADCESCRQLVAAIWKNEASSGETIAERLTDNSQTLRITSSEESSRFRAARRAMSLVVAAAAMLLIAVGVWWRGSSRELAERRAYQQSQQLLASSDFEQAKQVLAQARRQGVRSDRLLSLNSQAVRQLPGSLALASSGTLTDFGYDFDGTLARGPAQQAGLREAESLLGEAQTEPLELLLNRGHLRLTQNDFDAAATDFVRATKLEPQEPLTWLGLGLVEFARQHFEEAEAAFRRSLELDPDQLPARINRAMTLEELNRIDDARAEWQLVLTKSPPQDVRLRVEQHLNSLK